MSALGHERTFRSAIAIIRPIRQEACTNGNYTQELARGARREAYCWPARCGLSGGDDGLLELHHHAVRHPDAMDCPERRRLDRALPYPFILLNLALSFQAAYAAPFIMISQNRQAERDRHQADEDFRTNVEAERRIEDLQKRLAEIEVNKLNRIIELLERRPTP